MVKRKPVLLVDASAKSQEAVMLLRQNGIEYIEYDIGNFAESCCGDLPTTKAPSVFAPEGVFKGIDGVREYVRVDKIPSNIESESSYW